MLAKAPLNVSESIKFTGTNFKTSPFIDHGRHCCQFRSTSDTQRRKTRVSVRTNVGYTRKPLETAGAYELIDEETGEKFIVWGGIDDDAPIPSKEVLSWKPTRNRRSTRKDSHNSSHGLEPASSVLGSDDSIRSDLPGSFARLKAQKIRALSRKVSHVKKVKSGNEDSHLRDDRKSDGLDPELPLMNKSTIMDSLRHKHKGSILRASESQDIKDKPAGTDSKLRLKDSTRKQDVAFKKTFPKPYEHDLKMDKEDISVPRAARTASLREQDSGVCFEMDKEDASVSRAARTASLREWDSGVRTQNSRYDSKDISREHRQISYDRGFFSQKSFRDLGCSDDIIESLKGQQFFRPSHIQSMAFVSALEGKSCIIADQSGSGKTLAYLAPVVQRLREEELKGLGKSSSRSPRVVILVPTAELGSQVLRNCRSMSKFGVPFRSMVATGGFRQKTQLESLQQDLDVIIATPGRFMFLLKEGFLQLANLKCAVLDEVDILYGDEDFEKVLQVLLSSAPVTTQYLFVTATLPVDIYNKLVEVFPDCEVIMGPGMHRTSAGLEEVLVDCSGDDRMEKTPETAFVNKKSALLRLVDESPVSKTIIFCNKIETCRKVENVLKRLDRKEARIRVLAFHSALAQEARLQNIKEFLDSQTKEDCLFLICTDRASRGIDFAGVDHVVLFDFPRDPSEYVRRVGRTARGAGGKGKAFVFVVGKQVSLARRIIERNLKGHPLHDVPSAYELLR